MKRKTSTAASLQVLKLIREIKKKLDHLERMMEERQVLLEFERTQRSRRGTR
jgi:hypothetical protein